MAERAVATGEQLQLWCTKRVPGVPLAQVKKHVRRTDAEGDMRLLDKEAVGVQLEEVRGSIASRQCIEVSGTNKAGGMCSQLHGGVGREGCAAMVVKKDSEASQSGRPGTC